jgi:sigma-B regulation protein RsbU (phosphoserine phosphatase)
LTSQTIARIQSLPTGSPLAAPAHPVRALVIWAVGAAVAGGLVGLAIEVLISVLRERPLDFWFVQQSVLFAEAVGLSALVAARYAFPLFEALQPALRYTLVLLTLLGGAIAVTALSLALRPGVVVARPLNFVALVGANTILALVVGGALIAWERMKRTLAEAFEELRAKEAFEREMTLARDVQRGLLPEAPPEAPGYEIAWQCRSAAMVGGDTLDFVPMPGGRIGFAVGDVSGKGIAAALLMANVQALVRAVAVMETDPARINAILSEGLERRVVGGRYVTFACVVLDPASGRLRYSLAGHPPPLVIGKNAVRRLEHGGAPLGMVLPEIGYEAGEDHLAPGESLLIYTDGLTDASGGGGPEDQFGFARLVRLAADLSGCGGEESLRRILAALDVHQGGAPAEDDTTVVVVHRRAESNP